MAKPRKVSVAELAKHADNKDCWISVHGVVMDITPFLNEHPGGPDVIVTVSGKDCTEDFEDVGHTDTARRLGGKYIVGHLEGSEESTPLTIPTNREVQARNNGSKNAGGSSMLLGVSATLVGLVAMYYAFVVTK